MFGATLGYLAGPAIVAATGVGGISVTSGGISMVEAGTVGGVGTTGFEQARQLLERQQASSQITSSSAFTSNSYNVSELFKTQSYTYSSAVNGIMETITQEGANAIQPIKVIVRDGVAMIVDGHHRFQAFVNLGYTRVPIQYIHENQLAKYTVMTLKEMLEYAYK